jgi:hypothetical protein
MYLVPILASVIVVNEKNAKFLSTILLIWQRFKKKIPFQMLELLLKKNIVFSLHVLFNH